MKSRVCAPACLRQGGFALVRRHQGAFTFVRRHQDTLKFVPRHQRGFTLIEVVVAFAILALSLTALYQSFSLTLRQGQRVERRELALLHAQSLLSRVGSELPLRVGATKGESADDFAWSLTIAAHPQPTPTTNWPIPAYDVTATVSWGTNESEHVTLRSLELGVQP